jgi:aflatoxin B1 aldehyde reductase
MLGMFLDAGYSWVDTAFMYTEGASETILGKLLKGARRKNVFLATKAHPDKLGEGKPRGLTPGSVRGQLEASLARLRTDHVDLFYLHAPDNLTPLEITLATCADLVREGKALQIGLSNYASWQVAEAVLLCERNGWKPPTVYQGMYNAVTRAAEPECIPACRRFKLRFVAYNPLACGLLTGKHTDLGRTPAAGRFSGQYYRDRYWKEEYFGALAAVSKVASKSRITPADASLRWLLHHSRADGLLLGASKLSHLRENLAACRKGPLPPALVKAFDGAWERTKPVCPRYFRD